MVKCGQSSVPLYGFAAFCEVGIIEGFLHFLNIATLRYITNSIVCKKLTPWPLFCSYSLSREVEAAADTSTTSPKSRKSMVKRFSL